MSAVYLLLRRCLSRCCYGFILLFVACSPHTPPHLHQAHIFAFGTVLTLRFYDHSPSHATHLIHTIRETVHRMHHSWHAWQPSALQTIHRGCQTQHATTLDNDMIALLDIAQTLFVDSDHLFNPAAGALIRLWGFMRDDATQPRPPPSAAAIHQTRQQLGQMSDLTRIGKQLLCSNRHVLLDFGGFAKGYAVKQIAEHMMAQGVTDAIINFGGDLVTLNHQHVPWRIALRDPMSPAHFMGELDVTNHAVFTSGVYHRRFQYRGKYYHHIINPRTGYPSTGFVSATAIGHDPTRTDAAATSLLLAGPSQWRHIASRFELDDVILIADDKTVLMTPGAWSHYHAVSNAYQIHIVSAITRTQKE